MTEKPAIQKVTLSSSIMHLQSIMETVERISEQQAEGQEGVNLEEAMDSAMDSLMPVINQAMDNFEERIDARINFLEYAAILENKFKADADYLAKKAKVLANVQERLKNHTKQLILENPQMEFKGTMKKFAVQKNGGKTPITYNVILQSMSNIVDPNDVGRFPEDLIQKVTVFQLDKSLFESKLRTQEIESDVAVVHPAGTHLRIK